MDKTKKVKVTLRGAGLSYVAEIDEATAGHVMTLCLSTKEELGTKKIVIPQGTGRHGGLQRESAAEYLNRHAPKRNPDKILVLAGYLKEFHNKESFQQGEIRSLFRDAGEIVPANFGRDFRWAISNGWIAADPGKKGSYYITNTGLKVMQSAFADEWVKRTKGKFSGRRKPKETTA